MPAVRRIESERELDREADIFVRVVQQIVEARTPRAKPLPYAKRWWSNKLTTLRQSVSALRNRCTALRRQSQDITEAIGQLTAARALYIREIRA